MQGRHTVYVPVGLGYWSAGDSFRGSIDGLGSSMTTPPRASIRQNSKRTRSGSVPPEGAVIPPPRHEPALHGEPAV
jgi:hypothetical protein